jgi:hypothetical protein
MSPSEKRDVFTLNHDRVLTSCSGMISAQTAGHAVSQNALACPAQARKRVWSPRRPNVVNPAERMREAVREAMSVTNADLSRCGQEQES